MVLLPGRPLIYQELPAGPDNIITALPQAPFRIEESYLMNSILTDSALAAEQFETRLDAGLIPFAIYAGALIFLLVSLRFVMDLSSWPLANFFSGALVFRGILAFQTFIDSPVIQDSFLTFVDGRIEGSFLSPIIFTGLAVLILIYTLLVNLARSAASHREHRKRTERRQRTEYRQPDHERRQRSRRGAPQ
jgi:hypothetical protein